METELAITIEWNAGGPVYEQIARQIRASIASGGLQPGAALPPVRTLASDLGVNLNTVARAYRLLEGEGFVVIRDRSGAEVAAPAAAPDAGSLPRLRQELAEVLARMRQAGVPADEVRRAVEATLAGASEGSR